MLKKYIVPVETLDETPYMSEYGREVVARFNSEKKFKFWLVFECEKKSEIPQLFEDGYYNFLFNVKYDVHKDLECMFEELQSIARPYYFGSIVNLNKAYSPKDAYYLKDDRKNEFGNYFIK